MKGSVLDHNRLRLPMPIAEMGPWFFWAAPDAVGLSPEDAEAVSDGSATDEQKIRALQLGQVAMQALIQVPVNEAYTGKPS